jgi:hypothetical protein
MSWLYYEEGRKVDIPATVNDTLMLKLQLTDIRQMHVLPASTAEDR